MTASYMTRHLICSILRFFECHGSGRYPTKQIATFVGCSISTVPNALRILSLYGQIKIMGKDKAFWYIQHPAEGGIKRIIPQRVRLDKNVRDVVIRKRMKGEQILFVTAKSSSSATIESGCSDLARNPGRKEDPTTVAERLEAQHERLRIDLEESTKIIESQRQEILDSNRLIVRLTTKIFDGSAEGASGANNNRVDR